MMNADETIPRFIQKSKFTVFLSYSSDDEKLFEKYIDELKTGLDLYKITVITAPHDQIGGDDGNEDILLKIQTCDVFLVLHTSTCQSSFYFDQEVGMALAFRIPIVPICIGQKPYGFIAMKKCIFCNTCIEDKIPDIEYAIRKQYSNQEKNTPNILFRPNIIKGELQAIKLLSLLINKTLQKDEINQIATIYLSEKFLNIKATVIFEKLLTKNTDNLSDKLRLVLRKYNNENLKV